MDPQFTNLAYLPLVRGQEVSFGSIPNPYDIWDLFTDTTTFPPGGGVVAEARLYATSSGGQRYLAGTLPIASGSGVSRGTFLLTSVDVPFPTVYASPQYAPKDSRSGGVTWELRVIGISAESQGAILGAILAGYSYTEPVADVSVPPAPVALLPNFVPTVVATITDQHQFHDASVDFSLLTLKPTRWELYATAITGTGNLRVLVVRKEFPVGFSNKVETIFQAITNIGAVQYELVGTDLSGGGTLPITLSLEGYNGNLAASGNQPIVVTQDVWHVNALTGSDVNDGATAGTALQTLEELTQVRWGNGALLQPANATNLMTVFIDSNIPVTDPLILDVVLGADVSLVFRGGTFTTIFAGALTAATTVNRAANQAATITDALAPWAANTAQRVRNTTAGPRLNSISGIAADLGAGVARVSRPWITLILGGIPVFISAGGFAALDTYVIEACPIMFVANVRIQGLDGISTVQAPAIDFLDLDVSVAAGGVAFAPFTVGAGCMSQMFACRLPTMEFSGGQSVSFFNDIFKDSIIRVTEMGGVAIFGGLALNPNGFFTAGGVGSSMILTLDLLVQSSVLQMFSVMLFDDVSVFDSPTNGIATNPGIPFVFAEAIPFFGSGALYGSGNTNVGVHLGSNASLLYAAAGVLTITGAAGDFEVGAVGALATPDPATNTNTAAIAQTWANLPAARAAGFGGTVINPANQARILPFFP